MFNILNGGVIRLYYRKYRRSELIVFTWDDKNSNLQHIPSPIPIPTMDFTESFAPTANDENESKVYPYTQIPLTALTKKTRHQLSKLLNLKKILRSEEGYERDWRGIAALSQQKSFCEESNISGDDPMAKVLQLWCTNNAATATFEHLGRFLGIIDRWDVSDDIYENLVEDAKNYRNQLRKKSNILKKEENLEEIDSEPVERFGLGSDVNILTKDDVLRAQKGLSPQKYDAFLLFADADINYAVEILSRLEDNADLNFKLCLKDRDLLGGVSFTHVALTQLIEERCKHLIVILTEEFLKSPENKFLVNYTQALQIQNKTRKIIPLLYEEALQIPRTLKIYTHLKYNANVTTLYNFWAKLAASIRNVNMITELPVQKIQSRYLKNTQQQQQCLIKSSVVNLPLSPADVLSININGHVLAGKEDKVAKGKKERPRTVTKCSSDQKRLTSDHGVMRNAHSASQLNTAVFYDSNLSEMAGMSSSTCSHGDAKKQSKKNWSNKLFKKVFSRSTNRLQEA